MAEAGKKSSESLPSDDEIVLYWAKQLEEGHRTGDLRLLNASQEFFSQVFAADLVQVSRETMKIAFKSAVDIATDLSIEPQARCVQARFFRTIPNMANSLFQLGVDDVIFPVDRIRKWYKNIGAKNDNLRENPRGLAAFLRMAFSVEDGRRVFNEFKDRIGSAHFQGLRDIRRGLLFLSVRVLPEVVDDLMVILDQQIDTDAMCSVMEYFYDALSWTPVIVESIDWSKYVERILRAFEALMVMNLFSKGKGNHQASFNAPDLIPLVLMFSAQRDFAFDCLEKFLRRGKWLPYYAEHLVELDAHWRRQIAALKLFPEKSFPVWTEEERKRYAEIVAPSVRLALSSEWAASSLATSFAELSYEAARKVFLFALEHLNDPEQGPLSGVALVIVSGMITIMFSGEHLEDNFALAPQILEAIVPQLEWSSRKTVCGLISDLYSFFYLDENVDKLEMRKRIVFHAMMDKFDELVRLDITIASRKPKPLPNGLRTRFISAFTAAFIESKLNMIFELIGQSDRKGAGWSILDRICAAHPSLMEKVVREVIRNYEKCAEKMKSFWGRALAHCVMVNPSLPSLVPEILKVLKDLLQNKHTGPASDISRALTWAMCSTQVLSLGDDNDTDKLTWREQLPAVEDVKPTLYHLSDGEVWEISLALLEAFRPTFDLFETLELKKQKKLLGSVVHFLRLSRYGINAIGDPSSMSECGKKILDVIVGYLLKWASTANDSLIAPLVSSVRPVMASAFVFLRPLELIWSFKGNVVRKCGRRAQVARWLASKRDFISTSRVMSTYGDDRLVLDIVIPFLLQRDQRIPAEQRLWNMVHVSDMGKYGVWDKLCSVLESPDKTEAQFHNALIGLNSLRKVCGSEHFERVIQALVRTKFNKSWTTIDPCFSMISSLLGPVRCLRFAEQQRDVFARLQNTILSGEKGDIPEALYRAILFFLAMGPAPLTRDMFFWFWNSLLSTEDGRKNLVLSHVTQLLERMKPKPPSIIFNRMPDEQYMVDIPSIGFYCEPLHVKIFSGPAEFSPDCPYKEIRDELVASFDDKKAEQLVNIFVREAAPVIKKSNLHVKFWHHLAVFAGPAIVDTLAKLFKIEYDSQYTVIQTEMIIGVFRGSLRWSPEGQELAKEKLMRPLLQQVSQFNSVDLITFGAKALVSAFCNLDHRRFLWVLDEAREWLAHGSDWQKLCAVNMIRKFGRLTGIAADPIALNIAKEAVPVLLPLSKLPQKFIKELALMLTASCRKGIPLAPHEECDFFQLIFETIFDSEFQESNKEPLARFLWKLAISTTFDSPHAIAYITPRITKLFNMREEVTTRVIPHYKKFLGSLSRLRWTQHEPQLLQVLDAMAAMYKSSAWFVRCRIYSFVYEVIAFERTAPLSDAVLEKVETTILPLVAEDEKLEITGGGVNLSSLLLRLRYSDRAELCEAIIQEKNLSVSASKSLGLLGHVELFLGCPPWLPNLMEHLESLHRRVPAYRSLIEARFADFWKRAGTKLTYPEIEDYRYAFAHKYFA